ncbi:MAG: hypothetical protein BWK76_06345 [Desulfobulbaceae bacterium A2]|nr:MAG: hypothetical protein BWK76_06345 [Desulfobulbaceae bacterium A2]
MQKETPDRREGNQGLDHGSRHPESSPPKAKSQGDRHSPSLPHQLLALGFEPIPIAPSQKYPTLNDWPTADCAELVQHWPANHGIGLRTGKIVAVDVDVYDADVVDQLVNLLRFMCSAAPLTRIGQPPKVLCPVLCPEIKTKISSNKWCDQHGVINQIEVLSHGQQFVAYGIHPVTGKPYQWDGDLLRHELPTISRSLLQEVFDHLDKLAAKSGWVNLTAAENQAKKVVAARRPQTSGDAPGAIYNRSVTIVTVLEHYGWKKYREHHWTRPGKASGVSGSVFGDILWCFSSSPCLSANAAHDAFEIVSRYEFGGDKSACAKALRQEVAA